MVLAGRAQQRPHYSQYVLNNYIINPAISGIENYTDLELSIRNQWVGIPGAPTTFYLTVHGPIGKKDFKATPTSFDMKGENPRGQQYWQDYTASPPHHGVGLQVINYKTGYINRFTVMGSYAYHTPLSERASLAAGFAAGLSGTDIDRARIELANPIDPAIGAGSTAVNRIHPELSAGLWLYTPSYFVGLSAQQIIPVRTGLVNNGYDHSTTVPHLFATAGYRWFLNEDISSLPSVMLRYVASMPLYVHVNWKLQYRDLVWVGAGLRLHEGYTAMAGINISQTFHVSYSYDFNNANYLLQSMQKGTHEIVLGFLINNTYGDWCPRNIW
jgi:type IX secretion system PorP/SprF family membrane protein